MDNSIKQLIGLEKQLNFHIPDPKKLSAKPKELISAEEEWSKVVWRIANSSRPEKLHSNEIQKGLNLIKKPVLICGAPRSGTTLLSNLLDDHSQLLTLPPEGLYLTHIRNNLMRLDPGKRLERFCRIWAARFVTSSMVPPYWHLGRSDAHRQPYVEFVRKLILWIQALEPLFPTPFEFAWHAAVPLAYNSVRENNMPLRSYLYWVDKTPENEFYLKYLWEYFPEAKVLHMVRDPCAVFASRYRVEQRVRKSDPDMGVVHSFLGQLTNSHQLASQLQQDVSAQKYKVVKYEQLVEERQVLMDDIARFLGIEITDKLYEQTSAGLKTLPNTSFINEKRPSINSKASNMKLVAAYTGPYASRLGYELPQIILSEQYFLKCKLWLGSLPIRIKIFLKRKLGLN